MKTKVHKLLQITAIVVIALAAYASFKQIEGFQTAPPAAPIPNSATLDALIASLPNTYDGTAWLAIDNRFQKINSLKNNMNKSYPAHTTLMNTTFTESKAAGDKDDITLDKLSIATSNNYIPNSTTLVELRNVEHDILAPTPGSPPTWMINIATKMRLVKDTGVSKFGNNNPPASVIADLDKLTMDIFTASKALGERDDITIDKVSTAQLNYINNYTTPPTNSATLDALFKSTRTIPPPAWYTPERDAAQKKLDELAGLIPMTDSKREIILKYTDILNKAFTDSKAAGDKDDVTFDKLTKVGKDYLNKSTSTPSSNSSTSSNLPLYIGAGVGGVVVLGTIGYFMFSAA
jgi:hypothetical protein